ncbi:hypothetical protein QTP88_023876 [Uroleucon formosanum]
MENNEIKIILSGRGKELANVGAFKYRQVLRENCKRRGEESMSIQPLKLIRHELLRYTELTSIVHKDLKTVRKAIYDRRKNINKVFINTLPELPKSREDMFLQLNLIKTQADFMFNGQQFIHIPEDDSFVCITCDDNLKFMTTKCSNFPPASLSKKRALTNLAKKQL